MKMSPLAQGTGVPGNTTQTPTSSDRISRAKALAAGETPVAPVESEPQSGDRQIDRIKKIKMRTNVSPDRPVEQLAQALEQVSQTTTSETEVPTVDANEPVEVSEETKPLSPQFAALAKAKRALQVKERELAQREAQLATKTQGVNPEEFVSKADLKANPLKIFETGVTYDELTQAILNNQNGISPEINQLRAEIRSLKEDLGNQFTERDQLQEKQVLVQMRRDADLLVTQSDQYEAIREAGAQQDVVDLVHRNWKQNGEIMDLTEAADLVENQLIEDSLRFARLKKVQSKLTPQQEAQLEEQQTDTSTVPRPNTKIMKTLTNRDSARPGASDRRTRAIAAFNNKRG